MAEWLTWGSARETPDGNMVHSEYGTADQSVQAQTPEEFDRFEALSRKLVHVSKDELDDKRQQDS